METESGKFKGNNQRKIPDKGHHVNIQVGFCSTMLLCSIVESLPLK